MRISPLVILTALAVTACGEVPDLNTTEDATETDTETSTGTDTSTTQTPTTTTTGGDNLCVPGSTAPCVCPNSNMGSQECNADGNSYGMCECEGGGSNSNSDGSTTDANTTTGVTATTTEGETTTEGTTATETEGSTSTSTGEDTTTGGPVCEDPGPESNDSEENAIDLGEQGCGGMAEAVEGVLDGDGDEDWFSYHGTWSGLCIIGPNTAHTLTAGDDVRLCVYADCDQGNGNVNCPNGTMEVDSPEGRPGCCGDGDVDFNLDCGLLNDNARIYIRVDQAPEGACVDYSVQYDFDE